MKNFHKTHIVSIFSQFEESPGAPFDLLFSRYVRKHRQIGSKDRKLIGETCYALIRWKILIDTQLKAPISWEDRLTLLPEVENLKKDLTLAPWQRTSTPKWIFEKLENTYGPEKALEMGFSFNERAPLYIRTNTLKTTPEALLKHFATLGIHQSSETPEALMFDDHPHLFADPTYEKGLFEIQDEGSQIVASIVEAKPGDTILDYCAGAGGKALALGAKMANRGQLYLHDIRKNILYQAKKRLKRAGVQNAQLLFYDEKKKKNRLMHQCDHVLVDAPCSGSGTWRRNPAQKWQFTERELSQILETQRIVFAEALSFVKPGGFIIYATCSLFEEENEKQLEYFLQNYSLKLEAPPFTSLPKSGGMDGFFAARLSCT